ncbi:LPXTG cell wall anchor domain-containing protein [Acidaminobacter sp. JC074]|uniref:collagen binding domain-containing protein n=1 Tax=Acidaminobacter sp. JC074 TaxID=2530199 RepID=UPI001F0E9A77|nr:collagen binding domain-containing protein [Acidaminobacter sp. JC074]MCH4888813.1 LPXTG cell wall anchor domain-containing protein [Acidaminobacter sp. JC074]
MKKFFNVLLVIAILFSTLPIQNFTYAAGGYYFTDVEILHTEGGQAKSIDALTEPLQDGDSVTMKFHWALDNTAIVAGQTMSIDLPKLIDWSDLLNQDLPGDDGTIYGIFDVQDENGDGTYELKITFNAEADNKSNVSGFAGVNVSVETLNQIIELPYEYSMPINGGTKKISFDVLPSGGQVLEKYGVLTGDPNVISWTINVNTGLTKLSDYDLDDSYSSLLKYDDNMTIHEILINADGSEAGLGDDVTDQFDITYTDAGVGVETGQEGKLNVNPKDTYDKGYNKAYRLVYTTTIDPAKIDVSRTTFDYENTIELNSDDTQSDTVTVTRGTLIDKSSALSSVYNASSIDWTIHVNNAEYDLSNVQVIDTIPSGLTLGSVSIKTTDGTDYTKDVDYTISTAGVDEKTVMTIDFTANVSEELIIKYDTPIADDSRFSNSDNITFTNSAKLKHSKGENLDLGGDETVALKQGRAIYKKGTGTNSYNDAKFIIWDLYINMAEIDMGGDNVITDSFLDNLHLDKSFPIEVNKLDIEHDVNLGGVNSDPAQEMLEQIKNETEFNGFSVVYKTGDAVAIDDNLIDNFVLTINPKIDAAYHIRYKTLVNSDKYDVRDYSNTVGFGGLSDDFDEELIISNIYNKFSTDVDYNTKILSWNISINPLRHELDGLVVVDDFSTDQYMTQAQFDAISITDGATTEKVEVDGIIRGFKIIFPDDLNNKTYNIVYNTTMDDDVFYNGGNLNYSNTAKLTWDVDGETELSKKPTLTSEGVKNGKKVGSADFSNKSIDWDVYINYFSKNMTDEVLTDNLPEGLLLKSGSIQVYDYSIDADGAITVGGLADMTNIQINEANDHKSFTLDFDGLHDRPYMVSYKTDLDGVSKDEYINTASLESGESFTAKVKYDNYNKFISKTGTQNGKTSIDWKLKVNQSRSKISKLVVTDTLSRGLEIDLDSFKFTEGNLDIDGQSYAFSDLFDVTIDDKTLVTDPTIVRMTIKEGLYVDDLFHIEYTTNIVEEEVIGKAVSNQVSLTGESINFGTRQDNISYDYSSIDGFGYGTGEVGAFTMTKVDEDDGTKLSDAVFELRRGDKLLGQLTTDENGRITVDNLLYLEHSLTEITAPEGYELDSTPYTFTINGPNMTFDIENERYRKLIITKLDEINEHVLSGAEFEIYDDSDQLVDTLTTDHTGKVEILLLKGDYKIKEVKPPSGYYLNEDLAEITVDDSSDVFEVDFKNKKKPRVSDDDDDEPEEKPEEKPVEKPVEEIVEEPTEEPEEDQPEEEIKPVPVDEPEEEVIEVVTKEDEPVSGEVEEAEDLEVETEPEHGSVEVDENGKWTYTPDEGYEGDDAFTIKVTTPEGEEEIIYIEIDVEETPQGAVILPQTGQSMPWFNYMFGGFLVLLGSVFLFRKKS